MRLKTREEQQACQFSRGVLGWAYRPEELPLLLSLMKHYNWWRFVDSPYGQQIMTKSWMEQVKKGAEHARGLYHSRLIEASNNSDVGDTA